MVTGMTSVQTLVSQDILVVFNDTFSSLINSMVNTEIFSHVSYKTTTTTTTKICKYRVRNHHRILLRGIFRIKFWGRSNQYL